MNHRLNGRNSLHDFPFRCPVCADTNSTRSQPVWVSNLVDHHSLVLKLTHNGSEPGSLSEHDFFAHYKAIWPHENPLSFRCYWRPVFCRSEDGLCLLLFRIPMIYRNIARNPTSPSTVRSDGLGKVMRPELYGQMVLSLDFLKAWYRICPYYLNNTEQEVFLETHC